MDKAIVRLGDNLDTTITIRDHTLMADEPVDNGGDNTGPMPPEMLLGALGACVAMTCRLYARRKGWDLQGVDIDLEAERINASDYPNYEGDAKFVTEFRLKIDFQGELDDAQRARLLEIAGRCPVHRTLEYPSFFVEELVTRETETPND